MALSSDYTAGTISVSANGTAVTGVGTAWQISGFKSGDLFFADGWFSVVASVESNTALTLEAPWRGSALSSAAYMLRRASENAAVAEQARKLITLLGGSGNLEALGGLAGVAGSVPVFTGPGTMGLLTRQDLTQGVRYDVQVAALIDRAAYDNREEGFAVLVGDVGDGRAAIYSRFGPAGNWSAPAYITGPAITLDITEVDEVPYGTPPDATLTPKAGGYDLAFEIPRGMIIEPGTTTTLAPGQPAAVTFVPITGGYRLDIALPKGDTGDVNGLTPYWVNLASTAADAEAARAGLGATEIGDALFMAEDAAAARIAMEVYSRTESGFLSGFRDKIINGGFDIAQLGPSVTVTGTTPKYTLDMWLVACTAGISCTAARILNSPGSPLGRHRGRFSFTGTGAASSRVDTRIEGVDVIAGKATLSFFVADNVATSVTVQVVQNFGTGGSAPVVTSLGAIEIGSDILAGRKSIALVLPPTSGKVIGPNNDDYLEIRFYQNVPNAHVFELASVSLVPGDAIAEVAPFAPLHIQQLISLCQRYFEKSYDLDVAPGTMTANGAMRWQLSSTSANMYTSATRFAVAKKSIPAMTIWNPTTGASNSFHADTNNTAIGVSSLVGTSSVSTGAIAAAAAGVVGYQYAAHFTADNRL